MDEIFNLCADAADEEDWNEHHARHAVAARSPRHKDYRSAFRQSVSIRSNLLSI
jgi:hypothetical protein